MKRNTSFCPHRKNTHALHEELIFISYPVILQYCIKWGGVRYDVVTMSESGGKCEKVLVVCCVGSDISGSNAGGDSTKRTKSTNGVY